MLTPTSDILGADPGSLSVTERTIPAALSQQDFDDWLALIHDYADELATYFGEGASATVTIAIHRAAPAVYHALPESTRTTYGTAAWRKVAEGPTLNSRIEVWCAEQYTGACSDESEYLLSASAYDILKAKDAAS